MFRSRHIIGIPLAACLVATVALGGLAATPDTSAAGPTVTVAPSLALLGSKVAVAGSGFMANESISVSVARPSQASAGLATLKAGATGAVPSTSVTIPTTLAQGAYTLTLTGSSSHLSASTPLTLLSTAPAILTVTPNNSVPGNTVSLSGSNWAAGEAVTVTISGATTPLIVLHADASGNLPATGVAIPFTAAVGAHVLTATGALSKRTAAAPLMLKGVVPAITASPTTTNRGGLVTVSGNSFGANEPISITIDGVSAALATATANAQGQLAPTGITIPYSVPKGVHTLRATGVTSGRVAQTFINVAALAPVITLSTSTLSAGTHVIVTGHGFGRQEQITLALNGAALVTTPPVITATNGAFSASFVVPASVLSGANTISAIGNESRVATIANVTGVVPVAAMLYFAGASTMPGESAMLPILNPGALPAHIDLTFYYLEGPSGHASMNVAAHSRATVNLNAMVGQRQGFGVKLVADRSVTAELRETRSGKDGFGLLGVSAPNTTWYLAEGYTGGSFHEMLSLVNPGTVASTVQLRLLPFGGRAARTVSVTVAPQSAQNVDVNRLMPHQSLSVIANASQPIVLARKLTFSTNGYGITAKTGINTPTTSWAFATGRAAMGFQTFLTILNPNTTGTYVTASFFGQTGGSLGSHTVYVAGLSRANIKLNNVLGAANGIASVVSSNMPVVVERPEYAGSPNGINVAGSDVFGRNGAGLAWTFPSGDLNIHNDMVVLYNPSVKTAAIDVTAYGTNGQTVTKRIDVTPTAHYNLDVRTLGPGLTSQSGLTVRAANGVGIIAEQVTFGAGYSGMSSTQGFAS